jgi:hypothetical protein
MHVPVFLPAQWTTAAWTVWAANPAPGVLQTRATGHADVAAVEKLTAAYDSIERVVPRVDVFHDWAGITGYAPDARVLYTAWSKAHGHTVGTVAILMKSPLVSMGISVANIVLGGTLKPFTNRAQWEALLASTVARRGG